MKHKLYDLIDELNRIGELNGFSIWTTSSVEMSNKSVVISREEAVRYDKINISIWHSKGIDGISPDLLIGNTVENGTLQECMDSLYGSFLKYIMFARDSRSDNFTSFSAETLFSKDMSRYNEMKALN